MSYWGDLKDDDEGMAPPEGQFPVMKLKPTSCETCGGYCLACGRPGLVYEHPFHGRYECLRQDWYGGPLWLLPFGAGMVFTILLLLWLGWRQQ